MPDINLHQSDDDFSQEGDDAPSRCVGSFTFAERALHIAMIDEEGEVWFLARDGLQILELKSRSSLAALLDEDRRVHSMDTNRGPRNMTLVSESGLYQLISMSRMPQAKAFRRWLYHEVLPSIRRTGSYTRPGTALTTSPDAHLVLSRITETLTRIDERLTRLEQGRTMFTALPGVTVPPRTLRAELEALTDEVARRKRCLRGTIMIALYVEVRLRFHVDYRALKQKAYERTGRRYPVLDLVERHGNLPAVYNLALEHFATLIDRDLHPEAIADAIFMDAEDPPTEDEQEAISLAEILLELPKQERPWRHGGAR